MENRQQTDGKQMENKCPNGATRVNNS